MGFWIAALIAAAATALWVARPLAVSRREAAPRAAHDAQVFRDQLAEVARDVERGVLSADEARSARIEIGRRLLAADAEAGRSQALRPAPRWASAALAVAIVVAAPLAGLWLHDRIGAPDLPDQPAALRAEGLRPGQAAAEARLGEPPPAPPPEAAETLKLLAELEARVAGSGADRQGLYLLARAQSELGRWSDAWRSYRRLIDLSGGDAPSAAYAAMAEAMVLAAGGYVSPEAEAALNAALQRDPASPVGRFYIGAAFAQTGRPQSALDAWTGLLRDSPPDAPWREATVAQIDDVVARSGLPRPELPAGPQASAAEGRERMLGAIRNLDRRLTEGGGAPEDWAQLVRSYAAMGMADEAAGAGTRARAALGADPAALGAFEGALAAAEGADAPVADAPGPTPEDLAAAAALSPEDRAAMVQAMVGRLRDRLFAEGGPPEDWARLIRSLGVTGDAAGAAAAWEKAREAHAADPAALSLLAETAAAAGVPAP
jgi:cytochrome c-type biogenesis protein CcmH